MYLSYGILDNKSEVQILTLKEEFLFFVYSATCWLENVRRSTRVFSIWNLFSNWLSLLLLLDRFRQLYYLRWLGRGRARAREKRREKEREKS